MRTKVSEEPLLSVRQLAERLQVGPMWLYLRVEGFGSRGTIPHYRLGRLIRFRWSEILVWLEENRPQPS